MFLAGILALLFGGIILGKNFEIEQYIILCIAALCGVMLLYDVKDKLPNDNWFKILIWFLKIKTNSLFVLALLILFPFALTYLSSFSIAFLMISMVIGMLYSLPYKFGKLEFKLKNILFLKNILIGICWGSLVAVGAGSFADKQILYLTVFMMLQVFLGSIIRDLADVKSDKKNGIKSLPVVFGISASIWVMHVINLVSLSILLLGISSETRILIVILVAWRLLNLSVIGIKGVKKHLIQTFNLATCYLFFIVLLMQNYYGLH